MSEKFLKVDVNGAYEEVLGFLTSDFLSTSSGAGDSGSPIVLNASGLIDSSMLSLSTISHSTLANLTADDHTQYILADGSRDFSAVVEYASHPSFTIDTQLVDKKYVDDVAATLEWQDSVLDADILDPTALTPATGDRYLIDGVGAGAWVGQDNNIAEWNGSSWVYTAPTTGMRVGADDEPDVAFYLFGGTTWAPKNVESTTASTGLVKVGYDIQMASTAAGDGLGFLAGVLNVNVDDSSIETDSDTLRVKALGITDAMLAGSISDGKLASDYIQTSEVDDATIEWTGTLLQVKADGINDSHIDFGTGANQVNSQDIPILDAGSYTDETHVEGAIQEIYGLIEQSGVEYTASGAISKGDLVYVSGNDQVSKYSDITVFQLCIGLAVETVANGASIKVLANDTILSAILSGATAGARYFWNGTGYQTSIAGFSAGDFIYAGGVAKNATDAHVEVMFIKKKL